MSFERSRGVSSAPDGLAAPSTLPSDTARESIHPLAGQVVGCGLFARGSLAKGQLICEYGGPRLPIRMLEHGEYALQTPNTAVFIDGHADNGPLPKGSVPRYPSTCAAARRPLHARTPPPGCSPRLATPHLATPHLASPRPSLAQVRQPLAAAERGLPQA